MPVKLSTTVSNIQTIPNEDNRKLVMEFYVCLINLSYIRYFKKCKISINTKIHRLGSLIKKLITVRETV